MGVLSTTRKGRVVAIARRIEIQILADSDRLRAGFKSATASTNEFVRGIERTSRGAIAGTVAITGMGRAIAFASAQFLGGYGLLYALSASLKSAIEFQQSMVLIQTQAGGTASEVDRMTKAVLKLAPSVGDTPEQLAKGLYHIESSGLRGAKALNTLRIAAEGAKLGGADLEAVTSALVAAQQSGIKGANNLAQAMGALDAIIGTGNLRMEDLAHALSSGVLTAARAFGVGLNDIGAALSVLTVQGVPAQLAATRLRTSLSFLAAGTPAAERALSSIGLTTHSLGEKLRHGGMVPALELISAKLKASGLDAVQQGAVLTRAFGGARTATTIITLLQNIDQVSAHLNQINIAAHNFAGKWAAEQKTAKFATDQLKATVAAFADSVGLSLLPTVSRVSKAMSHWLADTKNQKRIQDDMTQAVKDTKDVADKFYAVANFVAKSLGGWHQAIEVLIALKLTRWLADAVFWAGGLAKQMWALATAETAVAAAQGKIAATSALGGASAAGQVATTAAAGVAARRSALGAAQRGAATQIAGDEGFQVASVAARREAAIAAMVTADAGFGGAAMLRTAGGEREVLNAQRLRLMQSQFGEGARVSEVVKPGFAGSVRPAMFSGGEGVLATGAAFASLNREVEMAGPRFGGLIKMFPALGTEIRSASGALGSLGLGAAAGFASYELSTLVLHATHLDGVLHSLGNQVGRIFDRKIEPPISAADARSGPQLAKQMARQLGPSTVDIHVVPKVAGFGSREQALLGKKLFESINAKKIDVALTKLDPTLSEHDRQIFIMAAQRALTRALQTSGLNVHAPRPTIQLQGIDEAVVNRPASLLPQPVSEVAQLAKDLARARLDAAKGLGVGNDEIIAALRKNIAYDEAGYKTQERLIKRGLGSASAAAKMQASLLGDEASAYGEIKQIQEGKKKDFALPISLQIAQARASNTASLEDDNKVAKQITAWVSAAIKAGKFKGAALVAAIQELGAAQQQVQAFNIPIKLQIAQAWAATTVTMADDIKVATQIRALIMKQIKAGKLKGQALKDAVSQLAGLDSTIRNNFNLPPSMQLAAAKAATTTVTTDDVKVARQYKAFAEAYLKSKKKTFEGMLAAYNVITQANATIGTAGPKTAYVAPSTHNLTAGLGLDPQQRKAVEQRVAQKNSHFATGGAVHGYGSGDTVPAMLTPGEIVFNKRQQKNLGKILGRPGASPHELFSEVSHFASGGTAGHETLDHARARMRRDGYSDAQIEGQIHRWQEARSASESRIASIFHKKPHHGWHKAIDTVSETLTGGTPSQWRHGLTKWRHPGRVYEQAQKATGYSGGTIQAGPGIKFASEHTPFRFSEAATKRRNDWAQKILSHARSLGVKTYWTEAGKGWHANPRLAEVHVPYPTNKAEFLVGLHELGHVVTHDLIGKRVRGEIQNVAPRNSIDWMISRTGDRGARRLEDEAHSWKWALENAGDESTWNANLARLYLTSYIDSPKYRRGDLGPMPMGPAMREFFPKGRADFPHYIPHEKARVAKGKHGFNAGGVASGAQKSKVMKFSEGGRVPGDGSVDSVPALLTPGEHVLTRLQRIALEQRLAQYEMHGKRRPIKTMRGIMGFAESVAKPSYAGRGVGPDGPGYSVRPQTGSFVDIPKPHSSSSYTAPPGGLKNHDFSSVPVRNASGTAGSTVNDNSTVIININGGDLKAVERTVIKVLQKSRRYSAPQRRGQHGGHTLGLD